MEPTILMIGRDPGIVDRLVGELTAQGRVVVGAHAEDTVRTVLEARLTDLVVIGGGLSDARADQMIDVVRHLEPHMAIHRKPRDGGPDGMLPFIAGLARTFRDTRQIPRRLGRNHGHHVLSALEGAESMDFRVLSPFNEGSVGVFHCGARVSPWERHMTTDEFLHVLDGEVDITVIHEDGPRTTTVGPGAVFVVQKGLWHRHTVRDHLVELYVTPGGTEHSDAEGFPGRLTAEPVEPVETGSTAQVRTPTSRTHW